MRKTTEHIAQLAKVSKATVSRVLNNSPKVTVYSVDNTKVFRRNKNINKLGKYKRRL